MDDWRDHDLVARLDGRNGVRQPGNRQTCEKHCREQWRYSLSQLRERTDAPPLSKLGKDVPPAEWLLDPAVRERRQQERDREPEDGIGQLRRGHVDARPEQQEDRPVPQVEPVRAIPDPLQRSYAHQLFDHRARVDGRGNQHRHRHTEQQEASAIEPLGELAHVDE
jgi:hypothetical protein